MSNHDDHSAHIVSYKTYGIILSILLVFTSITIAVTQIHLDTLTVFVALFLASVKSALVLFYFMHIKFDSPFIRGMVIAIFVLIAVVIFITFLDYYNR
jgi:cytochrome c oxidase subunit 4